MKSKLFYFYMIVFFLFMFASSSFAKQDAKDAQMTPQQLLAKQVKQGKVHWLDVAGKKELAISHESATAKNQGTILIIGQSNSTANYPSLIKPLRIKLTRFGWRTLAIALMPEEKPKKPNEKPLDEKQLAKAVSVREKKIDPLIQAALAEAEKEQQKVILLAQGDAGFWGQQYLQKHQDSKVAGLILISAYTPKSLPGISMKLSELKLPILDIFAQLDYRFIYQQAQLRRQAMAKVPEAKYESKLIVGANHRYSGSLSILIKSIRYWLMQLK